VWVACTNVLGGVCVKWLCGGVVLFAGVVCYVTLFVGVDLVGNG